MLVSLSCGSLERMTDNTETVEFKSTRALSTAKTSLRVSKANLERKLENIGEGLDTFLPKQFKRPFGGEELIHKNRALVRLVYGVLVCLVGVAFAVQLVYYASMTEDIVKVTDVTLSGYTCNALQKDSLYGEKWTFEECLTLKYSAPSTENIFKADPTLDINSNMWGYQYYPFGTNSKSFRSNENCSPLYVDIAHATEILLPNFDASTSCQGASLANSCVAGSGMMNFETKEITFKPVYVMANGTVLNHVPDFLGFYFTYPSSGPCEAYEKECVLQNINKTYALGEGQACHPCEHFKTNSPFLCTKSKGKASLEILSLSVSNTVALFSLLVAVAQMLLNKLSSLECAKNDNDLIV